MTRISVAITFLLTGLTLGCAVRRHNGGVKRSMETEMTKVIAIECLTGPIVESQCDKDGMHCKAARIDYIPDCAVIKVKP